MINFIIIKKELSSKTYDFAKKYCSEYINEENLANVLVKLDNIAFLENNERRKIIKLDFV